MQLVKPTALHPTVPVDQGELGAGGAARHSVLGQLLIKSQLSQTPDEAGPPKLAGSTNCSQNECWKNTLVGQMLLHLGEWVAD